MMSYRLPTCLGIVCLLGMTGCGPEEPDSAPLPRPVSAMRLEKLDPTELLQVTGLVGSWKTEEMGFEVTGRVQYVVEAETDIEGDISGIEESDGTPVRIPLTEGTSLARLDRTRYVLAVKSVEAQIETAKQQKRAASIEVANVIPAQRDAAVADLKFRKSEVDRNQPLVGSGAVSEAEFAKIKADYEAALAGLAQVDATKQAKEAEVASLQAKIDELAESLGQAQRDLEDCELRSPFRGQVAAVHVIPGGVVQAGQPVVTVQMMDPIKVDVEVSGETSRTLRYRDVVTVSVPSDGTEETSQNGVATDKAMIYTIDPVADPITRTFTVTLLMRNEKVQQKPPEGFGDNVVRVRDVWRLRDAPHVANDKTFVDRDAIHKEGDGHYVWRIKNWQQIEAKRESPVLDVEKVKVIPGKLQMDWLGLWTFQEVAIAPGEKFNIEQDFVAGKLSTDQPFTGSKLLWDWQRWRLRPGDLVGIDFTGGEKPSGYYVPIDSISTVADQNYVYLIENGSVRRVGVNVYEGPNTLKRIEAIPPDEIPDDARIVARGVHYLTDGEQVSVVEEVGVQP